MQTIFVDWELKPGPPMLWKWSTELSPDTLVEDFMNTDMASKNSYKNIKDNVQNYLRL